MKFNTLIQTSTQAAQMSDPLNHFLVALLFIIVIAVAVAIWMFAKWLTLGPWFKKKFNHLRAKIKGESIEGVNLVKGEVIIDEEYSKDIEERIKNANTPQELLEAQLLRENLNKEKERLEKEVAEKEQKKLEKIENKQEQARVRQQAKEAQQEYKQKEKERKAEVKADKKKEKEK